MKINCIAVDDEPLALELITDYIKKVSALSLVESFDNPMNCLAYLQKNSIDLLFLDIQMNDLSGIQLLKTLKNKPQVIFTTAYDNFAIDGYDLDIVDYLLKPISFERFLKAVNRVLEKFNSHTKNDNNSKKDYIFVKMEFRLQKVNIAEIQYIEGMGDYLGIVTSDERIMSLLNFKKIEEMLPNDKFCRVHKSFLVPLDKIISIEKSCIKIQDKSIPISDTYKKQFFAMLEANHLI
jgi:two-component system, LytTR family, response regulator